VSGALILVVEDDHELRAVVMRGLQEEGFATSGARTGAQAMEQISAKAPDALVIDVGLPDADGRDLCQALRAQGIQSPVIFLTARDALTDRLAGFGAGGDDYLTKPFSPAELAARLRAVLNRAGVDGTVSAAGLSLDPTTYEASCGDRSVRLTPTEFRLLGALAAQADRPVSRRNLVRVAWPEGAVVHDNTIDVYLARLRRKLRTLPGAPAIATVHGIGYRLQ
jgi:two-component system, OmpR family, response regulator